MAAKKQSTVSVWAYRSPGCTGWVDAASSPALAAAAAVADASSAAPGVGRRDMARFRRARLICSAVRLDESFSRASYSPGPDTARGGERR